MRPWAIWPRTIVSTRSSSPAATGHERALLVDARTEHLAQTQVGQVRGGVIARDAGPAGLVDAHLDAVAHRDLAVRDVAQVQHIAAEGHRVLDDELAVLGVARACALEDHDLARVAFLAAHLGVEGRAIDDDADLASDGAHARAGVLVEVVAVPDGPHVGREITRGVVLVRVVGGRDVHGAKARHFLAAQRQGLLALLRTPRAAEFLGGEPLGLVPLHVDVEPAFLRHEEEITEVKEGSVPVQEEASHAQDPSATEDPSGSIRSSSAGDPDWRASRPGFLRRLLQGG